MIGWAGRNVRESGGNVVSSTYRTDPVAVHQGWHRRQSLPRLPVPAFDCFRRSDLLIGGFSRDCCRGATAPAALPPPLPTIATCRAYFSPATGAMSAGAEWMDTERVDFPVLQTLGGGLQSTRDGIESRLLEASCQWQSQVQQSGNFCVDGKSIECTLSSSSNFKIHHCASPSW